MKEFTPVDSIHFEDVSFQYRNQKIFENFNFNMTFNQFIGIIGVNGSGKSTFLKLILGLLRPQKGKVKILNRQAGDFLLKYYVGSALQEVDFPASIRASEVLKFVSQQYNGCLDYKQLMKDFYVDEFRNKPCCELSGGMRRRLALACAFIGKPKVVLLDEPTAGLDAASRLRLIQNLKKYQKEYKALILMISHHPQEITSIVDQFIHIKNRDAIKISPNKINQMSQLKKIHFQCSQDIDFSFAEKVDRQGENYTIVSKDSDEVVRTLSKHTTNFKDLKIERLSNDQMMESFL